HLLDMQPTWRVYADHRVCLDHQVLLGCLIERSFNLMNEGIGIFLDLLLDSLSFGARPFFKSYIVFGHAFYMECGQALGNRLFFKRKFSEIMTGKRLREKK